jgi:hypothetical protein
VLRTWYESSVPYHRICTEGRKVSYHNVPVYTGRHPFCCGELPLRNNPLSYHEVSAHTGRQPAAMEGHAVICRGDLLRRITGCARDGTRTVSVRRRGSHVWYNGRRTGRQGGNQVRYLNVPAYTGRQPFCCGELPRRNSTQREACDLPRRTDAHG